MYLEFVRFLVISYEHFINDKVFVRNDQKSNKFQINYHAMSMGKFGPIALNFGSGFDGYSSILLVSFLGTSCIFSYQFYIHMFN